MLKRSRQIKIDNKKLNKKSSIAKCKLNQVDQKSKKAKDQPIDSLSVSCSHRSANLFKEVFFENSELKVIKFTCLFKKFC